MSMQANRNFTKLTLEHPYGEISVTLDCDNDGLSFDDTIQMLVKPALTSLYSETIWNNYFEE